MAYITQYTGSRYVPVFADPAEWNSARTYEPLTIVLNDGNSYTSRQFVPVGVELTNTNYWLETGNYNAQVEQYRQNVLSYNNRITELENYIYTPEQFGAKGNNYTDDTNAFEELFNTISNNQNAFVILKPNAKYIINSTQSFNISNASNIHIYGNNATFTIQSSDTSANFININNSSNIYINSFTINSYMNQTGILWGSHSRKNNISSNRIAFNIYNNNSNLFFNNITFNNMLVCIDCIILTSIPAETLNYISVTNCTATNYSIFVYASNVDSININNCIVNGAKNYGDGDHTLYIPTSCKQVHIHNIISTQDSNFGGDIQLYSSISSPTIPIQLYVENYKYIGECLLIAASLTNAYLNNIYFENPSISGATSLTSYAVINSANVNNNIYLSNANILNKGVLFGNGGNAIVDNINVINTDYDAFYGFNTGTVQVKNSNITAPAICRIVSSTTVIVKLSNNELHVTGTQSYGFVATDNVLSLLSNYINLNTAVYLFRSDASVRYTAINNFVVNDNNNSQIGNINSDSITYANYLNRKLQS